jgi:peptide/nickel transport system ATP-binding protein
MIFQDPMSSLNPRRKVKDLVAEGLSITHQPKPWDGRVDDALISVGMDPAALRNRRPSQLSGGQCQRIAIARSLLLEPSLLVCDEPVSALDVSVQAQILNLLDELSNRLSLSMIVIAHDLAVVKNVSDRVAVMYLGKICEIGPGDDLFREPAHPYTRGLLDSVPEAEGAAGDDGPAIRGDLPSPTAPPSGCRFRTRCPQAQERCALEEPVIREVTGDHYVACHFPLTDLIPSATAPSAPSVGSPAVE